MAGENTVGIDIAARLDNFRAEMAKIPDIGGKEAKALASQLSREIRAAEMAAKKAAGEAKNAQSAFAKLGDVSGKTGQSAAKLAGALDLIAPGAGAAARAVNDLADVGEVAALAGETMGKAWLPLAAAGAALAATFYLVSRSLEEAAAAAETHKQHVEALTEAEKSAAAANRTLADRLGDYSTRAQVAAGTIDDLTARHQTEQRELAKSIRAAQLAAKVQTDAAEATARDTAKYSDNTKAKRDALAALKDARRNQAQVNEETDNARTALDAAQQAELRKERATRAHSTALKDEAQAERDAADALAFFTRAEDAAWAAVNEHTDAVAANLHALRTLHEQVIALNDTEEDAVRRRAARMTAELQQRRSMAEANGNNVQAFAEDEIEIERWLQGQLAAIKDKAAAQDERRWQDAATGALANASSIVSAIGAQFDQLEAVHTNQITRLQQYQVESEKYLTDAQKKELDERIDRQRAAALRAFSITKGVKLAEAAISTASAVVAALDDAPIPFNFALAAISGAAGAAQIATIASQQPTFHTGGLAPDETASITRSGEAWLSTVGRDVVGDTQINAANSGVSGPASNVYLINRYRHRDLDVVTADAYASGGRLYRQVLESGGSITTPSARRSL